MLSICFLILQLILTPAESKIRYNLNTFPPCDPESEEFGTSVKGEPSLPFCARWNPDFTFNGSKCCGKPTAGRRKRRLTKCSPQRAGKGYCGEMTIEQHEYVDAAASGKLGDILQLIKQELGKKGEQAYCTVSGGFLANGRPIVPSEKNGIVVKSPERCLNFGTDPMVGMLEWLGREVSATYKGASLILGDVAGPRGGCLFGRSGRRGHASHTTGEDADVGFLSTENFGGSPPHTFIRQLNLKANWWFLKKIFTNPFACVKIVFLDRRHIRSLAGFAKKDPDWQHFHRFIRHMPGHKNHFHVRIGKTPGIPGCAPDARPELEEEDDGDSLDELEEAMNADGFPGELAEELYEEVHAKKNIKEELAKEIRDELKDQLKTSQSSSIQK